MGVIHTLEMAIYILNQLKNCSYCTVQERNDALINLRCPKIDSILNLAQKLLDEFHSTRTASSKGYLVSNVCSNFRC